MANTTFLRAKGGIVDSDEIVGCKVENPKGENLGKIESVMLDLGEGRVIYAVLSFGGFLGVGDKLFPMPVDALSFRANEKGAVERCIIDVDKETLKNAPGYDKDNLPGAVDRSYAASVYTFYGFTPWWTE